MKRSVRVFVVATLVATAVLVALAGPAAAKGKPLTVALNCVAGAPDVHANVQFTTATGDPNGAAIDLSCSNGTKDSAKATKLAEPASVFSYLIEEPGTCPNVYSGSNVSPRFTLDFACTSSSAVDATLSVG
jgi:hypothetical protein